MNQLSIFDMPEPPRRRVQKPTGRQLAQEGAQRAADHAGSEWKDRALLLFRSFAAQHDEFMTEDVRLSAEKRGFPPAPDNRAWGAVAMAARRAGVVTWLRYGQAKDRKVHGNPVSVWRSCVRVM